MTRATTILMLLGLAAMNALAAPDPVAEFDPQLRRSNYQPAKSRDPFLRIGGPRVAPSTGAAVQTAAPVQFAFRLEGILYHPSAPAAIVNDKMLQLNRPTTLVMNGQKIEVKAIEIMRNRVVLEADGQRIELVLTTAPKPKAEPR